MRIITAYFAGVGTVGAAVALGLGGGLLISNIVSPHEPKTEMSKLELRMSSKPIPVSNAPAEPVPRQETTQATPTTATTAAQPEPQPVASPQPAPPPQPAQTAASNPPSDAPPAVQAPQAAPREAAAASDNAFAKARDADVKHVSEREKRRAERRAQWSERRQQWTERRRHFRPDLELREVEEKVREQTEPRQAFTAEPVGMEMPRIKLFDPE